MLAQHPMEQEIGFGRHRFEGSTGAAPARFAPVVSYKHSSLHNYVLFRHGRAGLRPLDIGFGGTAPFAGSANNSDK
ncbi:hypothetical protein BwSH20_73720 [Bradyrhizobium ottawaense]|nr:hypothetical protein BwSH20_73720 [Bradyrhizobium ottawaense]GMO37263.1 hypothetical protein BwSF21_45340 [Bradyrhizobium ottawaense]GMO79331.1 hypothetical protein BwSG20_56500 [Bradyrhizobium ottawaense]GMO91989.1 hypothetical protein BwSF19_71000 [Bradyrhizobium ottawaense]GMP21417.1 hypothetical protein BwSH12_74270 [Bradyrhizobium ottawaense]